jgi:Ni/Co efflux regulator RcnB
MKRLLTSAIALSLLASAGAAAAQPRHDDRKDHHYDRNDHHDNRGHRWSKGQRLDRTYYNDRSHYVDYRAHHLRAPPRGYQWVRADNDYALVALTSGLIASIVAANN